MTSGAFSIDDVYAALHEIAEREFRREPAGHTLQPTALVNEAWLRVADRPGGYESRSHFLGVAAKAMRHVLVDHARRRRAAKRGGDAERVTLLTGDGGEADAPTLDVLDLDEALARLERTDERLACVVELKFFAGLTIEEVAEALGVSHMTVSTDWRRARVWLARELAG
ncbi:MAG: ECF-type sigma factor [Planctomycetota bacterium]|jgi:RNA polymerase sigma factor (TIGR02999 family)